MASEPIDLKKLFQQNKGPYGGILLLMTIAYGVLKLPQDQIQRLQDVWPLLIYPSAIFILGYAIDAYLKEQKSRTLVENNILTELRSMAEELKTMASHHFEDRKYYSELFLANDKKIEAVNKKIETIISNNHINNKEK